MLKRNNINYQLCKYVKCTGISFFHYFKFYFLIKCENRIHSLKSNCHHLTPWPTHHLTSGPTSLLLFYVVGNLDVEITNFRAEHVKTSSMLLQWDVHQEINGYVLLVNNGADDERTISVDGNTGTQMMMNLKAGREYKFGGELKPCFHKAIVLNEHTNYKAVGFISIDTNRPRPFGLCDTRRDIN